MSEVIAQIYIEIVRRCEQDAQYGNATHMRQFQSSLGGKYAAHVVKFAVHTLAAGEVGSVDGMRIQHVGNGYYELCEA